MPVAMNHTTFPTLIDPHEITGSLRMSGVIQYSQLPSTTRFCCSIHELRVSRRHSTLVSCMLRTMTPAHDMLGKTTVVEKTSCVVQKTTMLDSCEDDVIGHICSFLNLCCIMRLAQVSHRFPYHVVLNFYCKTSGLSFIRSTLMFFQDAMHIQKATVLSDDLISSLGAGESANSRVLQLLPAFASLSDTSDAILKFYKPRTKFACTLSKERYFDPYENNEIVFTDGSVEWKFVERKMPSDPILRVQDTHILCNAQLFLQYTTQSNCLSMLPILKNLQTWTDSTASLDANTDPIARMIVQMIRHNPTCANIVSINMEFRAHCTCVCQSFLMAHADFADLRLMWSTAPK